MTCPVGAQAITAHIPLQLAKKVDQLAARENCSKNWIVEQALTVWIDQEEERSRLTSVALADVVADSVIDHQAVRAWACSLTTDAPAADALRNGSGDAIVDLPPGLPGRLGLGLGDVLTVGEYRCVYCSGAQQRPAPEPV